MWTPRRSLSRLAASAAAAFALALGGSSATPQFPSPYPAPRSRDGNFRDRLRSLQHGKTIKG